MVKSFEIRSGVTACHFFTKVRVLLDLLRWTGMVWPQPAGIGSEAERERNFKSIQSRHLTVKPALGVRPQAIGPAQSGTQPGNAELAQPAYGLVQPRIVE